MLYDVYKSIIDKQRCFQIIDYNSKKQTNKQKNINSQNVRA